MREARRAFQSRPLIALIIIIVFTMFSQTSRAETIAGDVFIQEGSFKAFKLVYNSTGTLSYDISTASGPWIDIFILNDEDYPKYVSGSLPQYRWDGSALNIPSAQNSNIMLMTGMYYLVIDNTELGGARPSYWPNGNVTVRYVIEKEYQDPRDAGLLCFWSWITLLGLIGVVFLVLFIREARLRGIDLVSRTIRELWERDEESGVEATEDREVEPVEKPELDLLYRKII